MINYFLHYQIKDDRATPPPLLIQPNKFANRCGFLINHRSRETRINFVFQFASEKLDRFETTGWNFLVL
jgi:hypothetical protein